MGHNICGIVIDRLPPANQEVSTKPDWLKPKFVKTRIDSLAPKKLTITFPEDKTLILLDMITYKNVSNEPALTGLENDLVNIFPGARIFIFAINNAADFVGYSLLEDGVKLRTKCVVNDSIMFDFGDFIGKEIQLYEEMHKIINGNPAVKEKFDNTSASFDPMQKKKLHLTYRDAILRNKKVDNQYGYRDGSLDEHIIEKEFENLLGCGYYDLVGMEAITFENRKFDFSKESLKEYVEYAKTILLG